MSRLRVRIELNRGGVGVPLEKLASVVQKAQAFFRMLGDDVHIDQSQGEWLGFDFDHESLNFTAEFVGRVTPEQVAEFHSAFDGTTPLRRDTIAQFASIADAIDGDEVIGFGLYLSEGDDPAEWRCLSRRDALRITEEIRTLLGAGHPEQESHLPAVADEAAGARYLFGRRDRGQEAKLAGAFREAEANLSKRLTVLESEVTAHSGQIQDLRSKSVEAEQSMGRLLSAVEGFCEQAASRLETATAPALSAAAAAAGASTTPQLASAPPPSLAPAPAAPAPARSTAIGPKAAEVPDIFPGETPNWWRTPMAIPVGLGLLVILTGVLLWSTRPSERAPNVTSASEPVRKTITPPEPAPAVTVPAPAPIAPKPAPSPAIVKSPAAALPKPSTPAVLGATRVELDASEPAWVSIRSGDGSMQLARLIEPGNVQRVDIREPAVLRTGNAAGLTIRANGKSVGPLGPHGAVREVEFRDGEFKLVPVK